MCLVTEGGGGGGAPGEKGALAYAGVGGQRGRVWARGQWHGRGLHWNPNARVDRHELHLGAASGAP